MSESKSSASVEGLIYAFVAFGWWGVVPPLFFTGLKSVSIWEVLAHRVVWSIVFLLGLLIIGGRLREFQRCFENWNILKRLLITTPLIVTNWVIYVYGVVSGQVVQTSLGYFINPLLNVVFGLMFFGESLRKLQWAAVGLAAIGVGYLTYNSQQGFPWIAITLATSFGLYGTIRKTIKVNGLASLSFEISMAAPFAIVYLCMVTMMGTTAVSGETGTYTFGGGDWWVDFLLLMSAPVTAVPLLCFGQAARRLPLTVLGFIQYVAPTLQFLTAIWLLGEELRKEMLICCLCIWGALVLYSADSVSTARKNRAIVGGTAFTAKAPDGQLAFEVQEKHKETAITEKSASITSPK
ncbi:MAG: EamA family transporter RarD [Gemmataceae bacterium]